MREKMLTEIRAMVDMANGDDYDLLADYDVTEPLDSLTDEELLNLYREMHSFQG